MKPRVGMIPVPLRELGPQQLTHLRRQTGGCVLAKA
jgi:hypothetical protein